RSATTSFWHITMPSGAVHPNTDQMSAALRLLESHVIQSGLMNSLSGFTQAGQRSRNLVRCGLAVGCAAFQRI
ncbi:hypothetical protein, partial [Mesorhizobium caraganae]|uniref:hypothetical protein n=1 Tax=Mesorhizobium caraganae TaxID=483206 RepID=UPI001AEF1AC7